MEFDRKTRIELREIEVNLLEGLGDFLKIRFNDLIKFGEITDLEAFRQLGNLEELHRLSKLLTIVGPPQVYSFYIDLENNQLVLDVDFTNAPYLNDPALRLKSHLKHQSLIRKLKANGYIEENTVSDSYKKFCKDIDIPSYLNLERDLVAVIAAVEYALEKQGLSLVDRICGKFGRMLAAI